MYSDDARSLSNSDRKASRLSLFAFFKMLINCAQAMYLEVKLWYDLRFTQNR